MEKEIYFHVGLGKVASTYLQYAFFPKLEGIHYIQRTRYKRSKSIIQGTDYSKYLVSREFDQQLENEVRDFSATFPNARPILLLRRNDGWIASQYRRYVKNGGSKSFTAFFDVTGDTGFWKHTDLLFYPKIEVLEQCFEHKPLVLFHETLQTNPDAFFGQLAAYMGVSYQPEAISLSPIHRSYTDKQLRFIHSVSAYFFKENPQWHSNPVIHWIERRARLLLSYIILYTALIIPEKWVNQRPLVPASELEKIKIHFAEDWKKCQEYAARNNPNL